MNCTKSIATLVVVVALVSCIGSKKVDLDKSPYLKIENPYWQKVFPGQPDGLPSFDLILPYAFPIENYKVDSVYFRGYHGPLRQSKTREHKTVYRANFIEKKGHENVAPPITLTDNEALVSYFTKKEERRYFKVENIIESEAVYLP